MARMVILIWLLLPLLFESDSRKLSWVPDMPGNASATATHVSCFPQQLFQRLALSSFQEFSYAKRSNSDLESHSSGATLHDVVDITVQDVLHKYKFILLSLNLPPLGCPGRRHGEGRMQRRGHGEMHCWARDGSSHGLYLHPRLGAMIPCPHIISTSLCVPPFLGEPPDICWSHDTGINCLILCS